MSAIHIGISPSVARPYLMLQVPARSMTSSKSQPSAASRRGVQAVSAVPTALAGTSAVAPAAATPLRNSLLLVAMACSFLISSWT